MPWKSVDEFRTSETYKKFKSVHGWTQAKLQKFVAAFNEVYYRAKRNGADEATAESSAFGIAFSVAKRAASEETMSKARKEVHYFAAFAPHMNGRDPKDPKGTIVASEFQFTLVEKSLPMLRSLVAGLAFNYNHDHAQEQGVIRDIIRTSEAPAEVQKATDPAVPFLFVASYREDVGEHLAAEVRISPEWLILDDNEVLPMTFAATHDPLNGDELGIKRVASALLVDPAAEAPKAEAEANAQKPAEAAVEQPKSPSTEPAKTEPDATKTALAAVDSVSAKSFEQQRGSVAPKETPPMPDGDTTITTPEQFAAKVTSLSGELENERKARKAAEMSAAAWKSEFETAKKTVTELQAAALEATAESAALKLVQDGKATADQVTYFAALYKTLGQESFDELVAALPKSALGAYAVKAAAQVVASPERVKAEKERMAALLREG